MSSVMPTSPYCAWETIGGTNAVPRALVGDGETVGDGATVGDGLTVGAGLVLAGATHAPIASDAEKRSVAVRMTPIFTPSTVSRSDP